MDKHILTVDNCRQCNYYGKKNGHSIVEAAERRLRSTSNAARSTSQAADEHVRVAAIRWERAARFTGR